MISPMADITANGVFATLTFKIAEDATVGEHEISVSFREKDIYNANFDDVAMTVTDGSVTVEEAQVIPDIDSDGDVDETDAELLLQYITAHEVEVNEAVIDCNGDGEVNIRDVATILIYIKSEE